MKISPVAYATLESASDANTGRARTFGSSVCSSWLLENARPTTIRLRTEPDGSAEVGVALIGRPSSGGGRHLDRSRPEMERHARDHHVGFEEQEPLDVEGGLVVQQV